MTTRVERSYRGISERLAIRYLENLGGERVDEDAVDGGGWTATLSSESVGVGPTLSLTEVTVAFEFDDDVDEAEREALIEAFTRKAMRAGG
ncbi:hypothetical protein ACFQGT_17020 [Natrialbaceae archaeon GCM10025810]|uniref:hypothetical protein n=1 Tax=Halovalidus salilacus TaxID=3075124 RepID=UPI00361BB8FB